MLSVSESLTILEPSPEKTLLLRLADRNLPRHPVSRANRVRRRGHSLLFFILILAVPMTYLPTLLSPQWGIVPAVSYGASALTFFGCACGLARGHRATLFFLNTATTLALFGLTVAFFGVELQNAEQHGTNFGFAACFIAVVSFFIVPMATALVFAGLAVSLTAVRVILGNDLAVLSSEESPPAVAQFLTVAIAFCGLVFVGGIATMMFRILDGIDRAEAKEEAMKEKLQAIKLKTGFKDEDDEERVELGAERVIQVLRNVRATFDAADAERRQLAMCIEMISSNRLYDADTAQVKDKETANWLDDLLEVDKTKRERSTTATSATLTFTTPGQLEDADEEVNETVSLSKDVRAALTDVHSWGFDVWNVAAVTDDKPLVVVVNRLLELNGLYGKLPIERSRVVGFLHAIQDGYLAENPYHNAVHGADVAHATFWLLNKTDAAHVVGPVDHFAVLIAAAMHDVKHPGVNNNFLSRTMHPLAMQYNDKAILENMHVSEGLKLAFSDRHDIFGRLTDVEKRYVRKMIIELVLATDMTRHFELINQFKTALSDGLPVDSIKEDTQLSVLRIVMKMADVSNPAKPVDIAVKWTERVIEEFFNQGDRERAAGLDISPFMDRSTTDVPKTQVGFISFMITPLYDAFHGTFPIAEPIECLEATKAHWAALAEGDQVE